MADLRRFVVKIAAPFAVESYAGKSTGTDSISYTAVDWLYATHVSVVSNGEIGEARLCFCGSETTPHPEDAIALLGDHSPVQIWDTSTADSETDGTLVFQGVVVKDRIVLGGNQEAFDVVGYNNADFLLNHRLCLHGQHRREADFEQTYFDEGADEGGDSVPITPANMIKIDTPLIFNPDGLPNATDQEYELSVGSTNATIHIFEAPGRNQKNVSNDPITAVPWKLSWAIKHLLNLYQCDWALDPTGFDDSSNNTLAIFEEFGDPVISNVNLEGKTMGQALTTLLEPFNYGWTCPAAPPAGDSGDYGFKHAFHIFYRGEGVAQSVVCSTRSTTPDPDDTVNLIHSDITRDTTVVINNLNGYGAQTEVTTTADTDATGTILFLAQGWKDSDLTLAYEDDGTTVNANDRDFVKNYCHHDLITVIGGTVAYGVGRMWVVNQGQDPGDPLEDLTTDFSTDTDTAYNSTDLRELRKPQLFTQNSSGGQLHQEDIQVECSFDGGDNWGIVEKSEYRVLPEGMGIVFTNPKLKRLGIKFPNSTGNGKGYWQAFSDDDLQIRVLCSVKSDERINGESPNTGTTVPLATERIFVNEGYRKFTFDDSVSSTTYFTTYSPIKPDQDDTSDLQDLTDYQQSMSDRRYFSGTVTVFYDRSSQYSVGTPISAITNRMTFSPMPTIVKIIYDLENLHTQLILDSHKVGSVIRQRPVNETSRDMARRGIHQMGTADGIQVPFMPGVKSSYQQYMRDGGGG